jgi:SNF2 family DNA or RNA helicase
MCVVRVQHPYLIDGVEEKDVIDNNLVDDDALMERMLAMSGKMILLDKLLTKLHAQGSKVLIFSQFVKMLNLVEDFLNWRGWKHERLDGSTAARNRQQAIDRFSKPGSDRFVFMLSTKAGQLSACTDFAR